MLVCGLGAFGQAVVARLLPFGITLRLLDVQPPDWRSQEMQQRLAPQVVLGDMHRPQVLREAGAAPACLLHWRLAPTTPSALRFAMQQSLARYLGIPPAEADAGTVAIDPDCGALLERDLRRQGLQVRLESRAS